VLKPRRRGGKIIHHVGDLDIYNLDPRPFIPALANAIPSNVCDPHRGRGRRPAG
jgi:hypothetical protein